ncbi:MAG: glycosyltransferase family 4 protein [Chitinophagaceae bacterium]
MKIISTGYNKTEEYTDPQDWLKRISFYTGIMERLAERHEVISIERINYEGRYQQKGVQYRFINLKKKVVLFPGRMHRFIKSQQPDVVLVHSFTFPFQVIQLGWVLGKKTRIIIQNHAERPSSGLRKIFQRIADRYISAYLFTSAEMGMEWVEARIIASSEKIVEVMEVSASFSPARKKARDVNTNPSNAAVFLWVGRLNANKDPLTVVRAFTRFLSFRPSAKLYMIYQTQELLSQISELIKSNENAKEGIKLVGQIPNQQLQEFYESADFFISGSHYESGGVAVCEAMSTGCIPIVTDILSFRKMTGSGKCGLLYEPGNDDALLESLKQTEKMNIEKERDKVLKQFKEELSFEAIAKKINELIAPWSRG